MFRHPHKNPVLVLNASYEPLNICNWRRAFLLVFKGKAEEIELSNVHANQEYFIPSVIRLTRYVKIPHREIALTRRNLMFRDSYTCQYCNYNGPGLTIDHIIPKSKGGTDNWSNVVACCQKCNVKKGNQTPNQAGMKLLKQPLPPAGHLHFELKRLSYLKFPSWKKYIIGMSA